MSYNYLPLDRKRLNFEQVKNLLDYKQLVSITFDAHERILKCQSYLKNKQGNNLLIGELSEFSDRKDEDKLAGKGKELPLEVVKLILMLKIKSLGFGHSAVQIETVKRLMEMYNQGIFPVFYFPESTIEGNYFSTLHPIYKTLVGSGEVCCKDVKKSVSQVFHRFGWQSFSLSNDELKSILTGTQLYTAFGLFALKQTEQLLKMADLVAVLSSNVLGIDLGNYVKKVQAFKKQKGQLRTADIISDLIKTGNFSGCDKNSNDSSLFLLFNLEAHGAARDAFEFALEVFLNEANSVSENPTIFPDDDLIINGEVTNSAFLVNTLTLLAGTVSEVTGESKKRIEKLISENNNLQKTGFLKSIATVTWDTDRLNLQNCMQIFKDLEKALAIELLVAVESLQPAKPAETSEPLERLVTSFHNSIQLVDTVLNDDTIERAIHFITTYTY